MFFKKYLLFTIVFYSIINFNLNSFAQNPDPQSFFPHHLGDYWEYQFYLPDCTPDYSTYESVVHDSLLPDSNYLAKIGGTFYFINTFTNNVIEGSQNSNYPLYNLDAQLGEYWYAEWTDSLQYLTGKIIDVYNSSIFGVPTTIKVIDFWGYNLPDSLWTVTSGLISPVYPV